MGQCGAILWLSPSRPDAAVIRKLVGKRNLRTLDGVAAEFGVSPNTVKQSWRSAGMPGGRAKYSAAAILLWRIEHEERNNATRRPTVDPEILVEQERLKLRKLQLEAERLERLAAAEAGDVISREVALASLRTFAAALSEHILSVPDQLAASFPVDVADQLTADLRHALERKLVAFSEQGARKVAQQGTKDA